MNEIIKCGICILRNIIQPEKGMTFWYMLQYVKLDKWNKSDIKGQKLYDSIYVRYLT